MMVNAGCVIARGERVVALEIDMHTKRGNILAYGTNGGIPMLMLDTCEGTLKTHHVATGPTEISFPEFHGYTPWCAGYARYTVSVCLVKFDN